MKCPYCDSGILGMTGLQEAQNFQKHLAKCRENPNNIVLRDGRHTAVVPKKKQSLLGALIIRSESGQ